MNNIHYFLLFFSLLACAQTSFSQNSTSYYKLVKIIYQGDVKENTKGGQFITFSGSDCYDSDINGVSIGNGRLQMYTEYSNNKVKKYFGENYFGNAIYKFSADYNILNIEINKNFVYVYHRTTPPQGIRTSSLIKKKSNQGSYFPAWDMVLTSSPSVNYNSPANSYNQNSKTNSRDILNQTVGEYCQTCHGSGKCPTCNGTKVAHSYGNTYKCNVCGSNGNCPSCRGSGKASWNR